MDWLQTFSLVVGLPALAMGIHEITHLMFARTLSPVSAKSTLRLVALAPLLIGSAAAMVAVQYGFWQRLQTADPYYLYYIVGLSWLLYVAPSPADLRVAIWPPTNQLDMQTNPQ